MDTKFKRLFSNTLIFALASFGSKFILFFLVPLYTNVLTTEEYGLTELVITGSNLLIPFVTLSINDSILRFSLDKNVDNRQVFKNTCIILSISTFVILGIKPFIKMYNPFNPWVNYFIIIMILQIFRSSFSLYLKSVDKVKIFAIDNIFYTILLASMNIIFLTKFNMGIRGYFSALILSMFLSLIFQIICGDLYKDFNDSKVNYELLKNMIKYSTPLIANAVSWWLINSSDRFMINYYFSESEVGIYSIASKIPSLITTILSVFTQAWIISSITEYENDRDSKFYKEIFKNYSVIMILLASIFMAFIKPFMNVYVGKTFIESWKYVSFLLMASIFSNYTSFFTTIYKSVKANIREMFITLSSAIFNIIFNICLIPKYGILGAVIATMTSNLAVCIFCMFDTRKFFVFEINFKELFLNYIIVVSQAILISLDFYNLPLSLICILLVTIVNKNIIISYYIKGKKIINNRIKKMEINCER